MPLYHACMEKRTRATEKNVGVAELFRETKKKRRGLAGVPLTPRLISGLFCGGMFMGLVFKGLVPGVAGLGGSQSDFAQMNGTLINGSSVASAIVRAEEKLKLASHTATYTLHFTKEGRVSSISKAN